MKRAKKLISSLGAFAVLAAAPFSYAATSINANIPSSGDSYEGLVYIDPSVRSSVQIGQTIPFTQTEGFYRTDPYLDPTAKRQEVNWNHQNSSWVNDPGYPTSQVSFSLATALFEDGSGRNGYFYTYNIDHLNTSNGYPLVSKDDISNWVAALGGNPTYIDINLDKSSYMQDKPGDTWNVASLAQLANESGWYLEGGSATSPTAQTAVDVDSGVDMVYSDSNAWPTFKLFPTPAPTTSVKTDKPSYNAGDTVTITATSNDNTPNTGYHDEGVYVTGPNGYKKFLNITSGGNGTVSAAGETDTQFPYWGPNDTTVKPVYGGGSGDPNNPTTYNDTATLDTSSLAQGTYTVHFVMYDSIGRMSTSGTNGEVTATFAVNAPINPPINPTDQPGLWQNPVTQPQDYGVNLDPVLWSHWPHMGETGRVNVKILNNAYNLNKDKDWIGGYIDYTITATSDNPYFKGFTKSGEVFVAPPSGTDGDLNPSVTTIPIDYTVAQRQDPRKGYIIQFKVSVHSVDKEIPGKPPTYIPALSDADPNNDTAQLNFPIPAPARLTR